MSFGVFDISAGADNVFRVNEAKSSIRQNHQKLAAIGQEKKMICCRRRKGAAVGQMNFKWFERRGIPHFAQSFGCHN